LETLPARNDSGPSGFGLLAVLRCCSKAHITDVCSAFALLSPCQRTCPDCAESLRQLLCMGVVSHISIKAAAHDRVELGSGMVTNLLNRDLVGECFPVGPVGRHGIIGVRHTKNAGFEKHFLSLEPVGVALAVMSFMVLVDDLADIIEESDRAEDFGANRWMLIEGLKLGVREFLSFMQQRFTDADFAYVVQDCGLLKPFQ